MIINQLRINSYHAYKNKTDVFKSSEHINENVDVQYRGFGYLIINKI